MAMHWLKESSYIQNFVMNIMKSGDIPRHVAFIMDGNRRYARKFNLVRASGHLHGFERLSKILGWCKDLEITEISVFAFSYENFHRSPEEVDDLMSIAREKFQLLLDELDRINELGICVRFWGEINHLPLDLQKMVAKIQLETMSNSKAFLNVCFAYTSSREVAYAFNVLKDGVKEELISIGDITESLLEKCLYSSDSSPPDLLIRTSGEIRLSDYLLWQSGFSLLCFVKTLWPEFSFWDFICCIIEYQRHSKTIDSARSYYVHQRNIYEKKLFGELDSDRVEGNKCHFDRVKKFLREKNDRRIKDDKDKVSQV